jgi:transposase
MGCALPESVRRQIIEEQSKGMTLVDIAVQNQLSYSTVRNVYQRFKAGGLQGLAPHYERCGSTGPKSEPFIYRAAVWLKRHHQDWGAALIRIVLQERYADAVLPGERTFQRWFKARGVHKVKSHLAVSQPFWAHQVHEIWQIDAKEQLHLASGQRVCYLSIVDEKSGCLLKAFVFPPLPYQ